MTTTAKHHTDVLRAAESILRARLDGMLTSEEWERLALAVEAANTPGLSGAASRFAFDPRHGLTRSVASPDGRVLTKHRATPDELTAVADYAQSQRKPFLIDEVVTDLVLPEREPANAAVAFLLAHGFLERSGDYYASATGNEFAENAMAAARDLPRRVAAGRA